MIGYSQTECQKIACSGFSGKIFFKKVDIRLERVSKSRFWGKKNFRFVKELLARLRWSGAGSLGWRRAEAGVLVDWGVVHAPPLTKNDG